MYAAHVRVVVTHTLYRLHFWKMRYQLIQHYKNQDLLLARQTNILVNQVAYESPSGAGLLRIQ